MSWAKDSNNHVIEDPVETATEDRSSFVDILLSIKDLDISGYTLEMGLVLSIM